jgi:hypothetical protein
MSISEQYEKLLIDEILSYIIQIANPILSILNKNKFLFNVHNNIKLIQKDLIINNYNTNIKCTVIQKIYNNKFVDVYDFNHIMTYIQKYSNLYNDIIKDEDGNITFHIHSGLSTFKEDNYHNFYPNRPNYYSIYTNPEQYKEWKQRYMGPVVILSQNISFLKITIKGIGYIDIYNHLYLFNSIIQNIDIKNTKKTNVNNTDKRVKTLKMHDPVMYSFEQAVESKHKYSKICQKPFHPIIYTEDKIKDLSSEVKKKLVPFINATTKQTVYYYCDSKKAPYLGFIVNEHPGDYCIPCCRVKEQENKEHHSQCLKDYTYKTSNVKLDKYVNTYILKSIVSNRLSELPINLNIIFNKAFLKKYSSQKQTQNNNTNANNIGQSPFYIYGIQGLLNCVNFTNNLNLEDINLIHKYKINILIFNQLGNMDYTYFFNYDTTTLVYNNIYYYPIVNSLSVKKYNIDDSIIKFFISIIKKQNNSMNNMVFHFDNIAKNFDIKLIYVNNKNYIYGVLITFQKQDIYIPVLYYFNITSYKTATSIYNSVLLSTTEELILLFLHKHNHANHIKTYIYSKVLNKYIGLIVNVKSNNTNTNTDLVFLFNPIPENKISYKNINNINVKYIFYPIHYLSNKIMNMEYSINLEEFSLNNFNIYYKNLYQLIIQEISYYFYLYKNKEVREEILKLINSNINNSDLTVQLNKYEDDFNNLIVLIHNNFTIKNDKLILNNENMENFKEQLYDTNFQFDENLKYIFLSKANFTDISKLFDSLFSFIPLKDIQIKKKIKNILMSCKIDPHNDYCNRSKLIIPMEYKNKFINLFYYDIKNTFVNLNLLNNILYIEDFNQFDLNLNEIVYIEQYKQ